MDKIKEIFSKKGKFIILGLLFMLLVLLVILSFLRASDSDEEQPDIHVPVQPGDPSDPEDPQDPSTPELALVEQPLNYHDEYEINISRDVIQEIDGIQQEYTGFSILESSYLDEIEKLLDIMGKGGLKYREDTHTTDFVIHNWTNEVDMVAYNVSRDFFSMEFRDAVSVPNVNFNPRNQDSLKDSLETFAHRYFSSNFEYYIDDIAAEGLLYRVTFRRELNGLPVNSEMIDEHVLLTRDGKLKGGAFLLADFEEYALGRYSLISTSELLSSINMLEYPKKVNFYFSEPQGDIDYHTLITDGVDRGTINVDNFELVYYYSNRLQDMLVPTFLFEGHGTVIITRRTINSEFTMFASALNPDYVYIPPESYFELLKSN